MNYNINIREEIFGATISNLNNGSREYVTYEELMRINNNNIFPENSIVNDIKDKNVKFVPIKKDEKVGKNFSFADIAYIELTRKCNLRCKHCLNNSGVEISKALSQEQMIELIKKLADSGLQEVRFTGGEPLLFPKIIEIIKIARDNGLFVSIGTNATLIDENFAKKLKEAGLKKAIVSLDGTEEKHDFIRGKGNYQKTIKAIKLLEQEEIDVRINSVIMRSNMEDIIKFAKQMHKNKTKLFIRRFIESGRGASLENNTLDKNDYEYVKEQLGEEIKSNKYVNGHYLRNDEEISYRIELPFKYTEGCKAGARALIISPDGDIHLCGFLAAQGFPAIGNVRNVVDWREYWNDIHKKDYLHDLRSNLEKYNQLLNVQETNCLAYVQNYINKGKALGEK